MDPTISEFSYGYAVTQELSRYGSSQITAAPVFPSLKSENKLGWDVQIPFEGTPLFLQFKLAQKMVRRSAIERRHVRLQMPFFRVNLMPGSKSPQHRLLYELDLTGALVAYAAPLFSTAEELDDAFLSRMVVQRSILVPPRAIGPLDDEPHHLSYRRGSPIYRFSSEPQEIGLADDSSKRFLERIRRRQANEPRVTPSPESFRVVADGIADLVERSGRQEDRKRVGQDRIRYRNADPVSLAAHLSMTFLGCVLLVVSDEGRQLHG